MTTTTKTKSGPDPVWAVMYAKGNQRRLRRLHTSKKGAEAAISRHKPASEREHLEVERVPVHRP
jgi:hypothetical protein